MLPIVVIASLMKLGACSISGTPDIDPTTEEEFLQIRYEPADLAISWEAYKAEHARQVEKRKVIQLRMFRDRLLQKSDWVMTQDVFDTLENKAEWVAYRQALRDLPSTLTEYVWNSGHEGLDFTRMNIPVAPPVTRKPATS
jgi:hypothetical protein